MFEIEKHYFIQCSYFSHFPNLVRLLIHYHFACPLGLIVSPV